MRKIVMGILVCALLLTGCGSNTRKGTDLLKEGKYQEAIAMFEADLAEEKNEDEANRGIGIAYFELGKYEEAVKYFEKALACETEETASLYHLMGTACFQYEDYKNAVEYFDAALKFEDCTDDMKKEMMFNKIAAYEKMLDWESAREAANAYLKVYPDDEAVQKEAAFLETR